MNVVGNLYGNMENSTFFGQGDVKITVPGILPNIYIHLIMAMQLIAYAIFRYTFDSMNISIVHLNALT